MKKSIIILNAFFALICFACSSNDSIDNQDINGNEPSLSNYIYKTYNVTNTPNTVIDSTNYNISDHKIISSSSLNLETLSQQSSNYTYVNGKIGEIRSFSNGVLSRIQSFTYNANDNLVEYLSESVDANGSSSNFQRHTFTHTTDTIFSSWERSNDGLNFDTSVSDFKIVLDGNDNRTYLETYSYLNNDTQFEVSTYDANSNILNESKYLIFNNGNELLFENNYTTNTSENYFNTINEDTFTRKNVMLLYHLQSGAVNNINAKSISTNTLNTFDSTWGNSFADFEISNTIDTNNKTLSSDFKTIISGDVISRFSQEYIFQE
nr:hypothetical protein [uncultured Psychroserpens sp.]